MSRGTAVGSNRSVESADQAPPLDETVSRRWFLNRMAWVSSAAAAGTLFSKVPAAAGTRGPSVTEEAFGAPVRLQDVGDLTELTLSQSMTLIRNESVSPVELVEAHVDRIEAFDADFYKAYAARPTREALIAEAERVPAEGPDAPLRGIGLAPKDNFYTSDLLTEGGSLVFEGFQPDYDGTVIALMRAAGGLVLGKAQMGNLAGGRAQVYGTTTPTTRNAWTPNHVGYSPGGSSSGTATCPWISIWMVPPDTSTWATGSPTIPTGCLTGRNSGCRPLTRTNPTGQEAPVAYPGCPGSLTAHLFCPASGSPRWRTPPRKADRPATVPGSSPGQSRCPIPGRPLPA